jgi:hypothetical protein
MTEEITLSTGVVLKPKQIPPRTYIRVATQTPPPTPPRDHVPGKPNILIPNPDNEYYIKEFQQWEQEQAARLLYAMVLYGIEEIVKVPKGMEKHTGNKWIDKMRYTGSEVFPEDREWRKANWILEIAMETSDDFELISTGVGRLTGVAEEDVQLAAQFPEREDGS